MKQKDLDEYKRRINLKNKETSEYENKTQGISPDANFDGMSTKEKNIKELSDNSTDIMNENIHSEKHYTTNANHHFNENINTMFEKKGALTEIDMRTSQENLPNKIEEDENCQKQNYEPPLIATHSLQGSSKHNPINFEIEPPKFLNIGECSNMC